MVLLAPLVSELLKPGPGKDGNGGSGGGGGGEGGGGEGGLGEDGNSVTSAGLSPLEVMARNHALLCTIGFLILLPVGSLVARYARTFTNKCEAIPYLLIGCLT
jgi:hypothetical protein